MSLEALLARENHQLREKIKTIRDGVARFVNAQGPHLPEQWRDHLIECCELTVDEGNPYRPVVAGSRE